MRFDGTSLKLLTPEPGNHSVSMNPNGKTFIDTYSSIDQPKTIKYRSSDGTLIRTLGSTDLSDFDQNKISKPSIIRFLADDKETVLNGIVTLPLNYEEGKTYPLIVYGYGMPGTQIVRNSWQGGFQQFLAKEGYNTFNVTDGFSGNDQDSGWKNLGLPSIIDN